MRTRDSTGHWNSGFLVWGHSQQAYHTLLTLLILRLATLLKGTSTTAQAVRPPVNQTAFRLALAPRPSGNRSVGRSTIWPPFKLINNKEEEGYLVMFRGFHSALEIVEEHRKSNCTHAGAMCSISMELLKTPHSLAIRRVWRNFFPYIHMYIHMYGYHISSFHSSSQQSTYISYRIPTDQ